MIEVENNLLSEILFSEDLVGLPSIQAIETREDFKEFLDLLDHYSLMDFKLDRLISDVDFAHVNGGLSVLDSELSIGIFDGADQSILSHGNVWGVLSATEASIEIFDNSAQLFFDATKLQNYTINAEGGSLNLYNMSTELLKIQFVNDGPADDLITISIGNTLITASSASFDNISIYDPSSGKNLLDTVNMPALAEQEIFVSQGNLQTINASYGSSDLPSETSITEESTPNEYNFNDDFMLNADPVYEPSGAPPVYETALSSWGVDLSDLQHLTSGQGEEIFMDHGGENNFSEATNSISSEQAMNDSQQQLVEILTMTDTSDYAFDDALDLYFSI